MLIIGYILRKAISRAIHAHFVVDMALNAVLMSQQFSIHPPQEKDEVRVMEANKDQLIDGDLETVHSLYDELMSDPHKADEECTSETLKRIIQRVAATKGSMLNQCTASLWL